jgi:hypothetical protein
MAGYKLTAVGRLLDRDHAREELSLPITPEQYADPTFITRLSFRHVPRFPTDVKELTAYLPKHADHALFIDTNLTWLDSEWWETLLAEPKRVHVTGRVLRELVPFMQRNPKHPLGAALADRHPAIVLHPDPDNDSPDFKCLQYYSSILAYRRFFLVSAIEHFKAAHGREPVGREMTDLKMALQRFAGERTLRLNTKSASPIHTDEVLSFLAVHHAVITGQPTKIFSGDSDVEEQFYMMIRLLTAHYYGMILGRRYAADFVSFRPRALSAELVANYGHVFEPHNATIIDLGGRGIHDFIPKHTTFVPVSCTTIGKEYSSELTYGAETAMADVFATKAATLGLSTDRLGGRNVHPWMVPEEFQLPGSHGALVAFDKSITLPDTTVRVAQLDIMMTAWPGDPHARIGAPSAPNVQPPQSAVLVPSRGHSGVVRLPQQRPPTPRSAPGRRLSSTG